jgi:hypothetical protein
MSGGDAIRRRSARGRLTANQQLVVLLGVVTLLVLGGTRLGIALWPALANPANGAAPMPPGGEAPASGDAAVPGDAPVPGAASAAVRTRAGGIIRGLLRRYECPLRRTTGIACPTCGGTRAMVALTTGHPLRALVWNPLVTLAAVGLPALGLLVLVAPVTSARLLRPPRRWVTTRWGRTLIATAVAAQIVHVTLLLR